MSTSETEDDERTAEERARASLLSGGERVSKGRQRKDGDEDD